MRPRPSRRLLLVLAMLAAACEGTVFTPPPPAPEELPPPRVPGVPEADACKDVPLSVSASPLARLTRDEYLASLNALLPGLTVNADLLPAGGSKYIYERDVRVRDISAPITEAWFTIAEQAARATNPQTLLGCTPTAPECLGNFLDAFGRRAFRRPLDIDEKRVFLQQFDSLKAKGQTNDDAVRAVLTALLLSPQFLMLVENTRGPDGAILDLEAFALASRLAFLVTRAPPDAELLGAAESGALLTDAGLKAQLDRLMQTSAAQAQVKAFFAEWFQLGHLDEAMKTNLPQFEALKPDMRAEVEATSADTFWKPGGTLGGLLTRGDTFISPRLAAVYGVPAPAAFGKVALPASERRGILTTAALLSLPGNPDRTSPTRRGKFLREQFLCQTAASPPADVDTVLPPASGAMTTRERLAEHTVNPGCAGCHRLLDPVGFTLENYDEGGRYRTTENGVAVDASGELINTDVDGKLTGGFALIDAFARSETVGYCFTTQLTHFTLGRVPQLSERCEQRALFDAFKRTNGDMRALFETIVLSPSFRKVRTEAAP